MHIIQWFVCYIFSLCLFQNNKKIIKYWKKEYRKLQVSWIEYFFKTSDANKVNQKCLNFFFNLAFFLIGVFPENSIKLTISRKTSAKNSHIIIEFRLIFNVRKNGAKMKIEKMAGKSGFTSRAYFFQYK